MKYPIIICSLYFLSQSVFAQEMISYRNPRGEFRFNQGEYEALVIQFDFEAETFNQPHRTVDHIFSLNQWQKVIDYSFGKVSPISYVEALDEVADDIDRFRKQHALDSFELFHLLIAFSNSLEKIQHPSYNSSLFYFPHEFILTGVHKDLDRQSLFAGLLSMFCYDASIVIKGREMIVGVLVTDEEDFSLRESKYKALKRVYEHEVVPVYGYEKICRYQKTYQQPIEPYFTQVLKEIPWSGSNRYAFSSVQSNGFRYSATVRLNDAAIGAAREVLQDRDRLQANHRIKGYVVRSSSQLRATATIE